MSAAAGGFDPLVDEGLEELRYLVQFRYGLNDFLLPELDSLIEMVGLAPHEVYDKSHFNPEIPFLRIKLPSDQVARNLVRRSVMIKGIFELWGAGRDLASLYQSVKRCPEARKAAVTGQEQRWCMNVESFGTRLSNREVDQKREAFLAGDHGVVFRGKAKLKGEGRHLMWLIEHLGAKFVNAAMRLECDGIRGAESPFGSEPIAPEHASSAQTIAAVEGNPSKRALKREMRRQEKLRIKREKSPAQHSAKAQQQGSRPKAHQSASESGAQDAAATPTEDLEATVDGGESTATTGASKKARKDAEREASREVSSESERKMEQQRKVQLELRSKLKPEHVFFCREVGRPEKRHEYDLKHRAYLGPTSMENGMAFVMANQGLVRSGSIVLDPFVGTGSILVPCSVFGATCLGGDIDYLTLRGKEGKTPFSSFDQFGLPHPDLVRLDFSPRGRCLREPPGGWVDAIVCDPPYGIRAGARKVGSKKAEVKKIPDHLLEGHIAPTQPYDTGELMVDLVDASARLLKLGGRLVYLLPVVRTQYSERVLPQHPCMAVEANSEQELRYPVSRRLITMRKVAQYDYDKAAEYVADSRARLETPNFADLDLAAEEGTFVQSSGRGSTKPSEAITGVRAASFGLDAGVAAVASAAPPSPCKRA